MADVTPAPTVETKKENVKPEKPDEGAYKAALKQAEKEHADSMTKFVSSPLEHICKNAQVSVDCIDSY